MSSQLFKTGLPAGVKWTPKIVRRAAKTAVAKRPESLATLNKRLAATKKQRQMADEKNCRRLTGESSF